MFDKEDEAKFECLEDEEDDMQTQDSQPQFPQDQHPISADQLEQHTFMAHSQGMPSEVGGIPQNPMSHHPMQTSQFDQNQQNMGFPQSSMFPPFSSGGMTGNAPLQQPMNQYDNPMGFPGFPGQEGFGGFGQPFGNPIDAQPFGDNMGFGGSMFGPGYGRDEEFEKIFGQPSQPHNMGGMFPNDPSERAHQDMGGLFGFNVEDNQFMAQQDDDEEEDDWLMDEDFQDKHLNFIDQHGDTPSKDVARIRDQEEDIIIKPQDVIERAYKYVKSDKKRVPKPRRVHTFNPKLRSKKRFEKLFDKEEEDESQSRKPLHQNLNMYLVKKYWDMRDEPNKLEMINLTQNPFSYHILNKRLAPPQFFLNKDGPIHISELFMWYNQGLVAKTYLVGHDEN